MLSMPKWPTPTEETATTKATAAWTSLTYSTPPLHLQTQVHHQVPVVEGETMAEVEEEVALHHPALPLHASSNVHTAIARFLPAKN